MTKEFIVDERLDFERYACGIHSFFENLVGITSTALFAKQEMRGFGTPSDSMRRLARSILITARKIAKGRLQKKKRSPYSDNVKTQF